MHEIVNFCVSPEQNFKKRWFLSHAPKPTSYTENWNKETPAILCSYLSEVHNIQLPEDFELQLASTYKKSYTRYKISIMMFFNYIDAIVESCNIWKSHINNGNEIFDEFVCSELLHMVRMHASVISAKNIKYEVSPLTPPNLVTIVTKLGVVKVYP